MTHQRTTIITNTALLLAGLLLLGCDRVEVVDFVPRSALVDPGNEPAPFDVDAGCQPSDGWMPFPVLDREGPTGIVERPDGVLVAISDDCRIYYDHGTGWERGYGATYWMLDGGATYTTISQDFEPSPAGYIFSDCAGIWYARDRDAVVTIGTSAGLTLEEETETEKIDWDLRYWWPTSAFFSTDLSTVRAWSHPDAVPPGYRAGWFGAVFGTSSHNFLTVGGRADGPMDASGSLVMALEGAERFTGLIVRHSVAVHDPETPDYLADYDYMKLSHSPEVPLADVFGNTVSDFWVVGNALDKGCPRVTGKVFHCNDEACEEEISVEGAFLTAIHGASTSDMFVVGGNFEENTGGIVLQRKGDSWRRHDLPVSTPLRAVFALSRDDVIAVGGGYSKDGEPGSVALRYDGTDWRTIEIGSARPLHDVFAASGDDIHIVGEEGFFHYPDPVRNDMEEFRITDHCEVYIAKLILDGTGNPRPNSTLIPYAERVPLCREWLEGTVSEGPACRDSVFDLIDCLTTTPPEETLPILTDPTTPDVTCSEAYANVACTDFRLFTYSDIEISE